MSQSPVTGKDVYVVKNSRELEQASLDFAGSFSDYIFEYEEYPYLTAQDEDGVQVDVDIHNEINYPVVVVFRRHGEDKKNYIPTVEIVRTFNMQETFAVFNDLIAAGGNVRG